MQKNFFVISVSGLASGKTRFDFEADKEFFAKFENTEVLDADLAVTVVAEKIQRDVIFDCEIKGEVTVPCDRCLSPVRMPVQTEVHFKLGTQDGCTRLPDEDEVEYEEVFLSDGSDSLDLSQEIYDFALLALPLQRFHKEGECDKAALDHLSREDDAPDSAPMDTPFASLANMLNDKKLK